MTEAGDPQSRGARPSFIGDLRALLSITGRRRRLQLALTFILMFVGSIAELVTIGAVLPLLAFTAGSGYAERMPAVGRAMQALGLEQGRNLVVTSAGLLIGAAVISAILRLMLTWMTQKFVFGLQMDLTTRIYGRVIRQPYEQFVRQNSSTVISGIDKIYYVAVSVIFFVLNGLTSAGMALVIIAFLFLIDPVTAAVASLSMGLLYVVITVVIRRLTATISSRSAFIRTARVKLLQESLGGMRDIILDQSEPVFEDKFLHYENEMRRLQILSNFISTAPRFVVEAAGISLVALLSIYFSFQPGGMMAALPVLGALALGAQRLLPMLQTMYLGWTSYSVNAHNLRDVVALLHLPVSPARKHPRRRGIAPFSESIALRHVSFSYGGDGRALDGIDLSIRKGERIGLIGKTGSGKSTLVDLLMGLLRPTEGVMLLDGVAVDDGNVGNLQAQIAHVPQAIFLADDTIAANIAFGAGEALDIDRVWQAARSADIADFIAQLPDGIVTEVGERGIRLSGGQRQRIGIARALYKKATILILDEATSALDDATEAAVMASVAGLGRDLTIVLIAHRLSTVASCDCIYRLDGGRIVQQGRYEEVVAPPKDRTAAITARDA